MLDVALLVLRLTVGALLAGHGAQKLFGAFEGPGFEGAAGMVESLGFRPGRPWALMASVAEFGGGLLILLGFLSPLGPLAAGCSMLVAAFRAHWAGPYG